MKPFIFGGGTPPHLPIVLMDKLVNAIHNNFNITKYCEITIEMDPESVNEDVLRNYLSIGFNRFSMGVQSFNDQVLTVMGRIHERQEALDKIQLIQSLLIDNFSIDLMFTNPIQDFAVLKEDIETAISLNIPHISIYSLMYEPHTIFTKWLKEGQITKIDDETDRAMYHYIREKFEEVGLKQYEISNFSKKDYQCRHNLKYWQLEDYLGLVWVLLQILDVNALIIMIAF